MKKVVLVISIFVIFIILYFLQANFFNWFTIAEIHPNLFVIFILIIGLFGGEKIAFPTGIILGILLDLFICSKIGITSIMLGLTGILAQFLDKNFTKESRATLMLMVIGTTFFYEFGLYVLNAVILNTSFELIPFIKICFIEMLYNAILTIILYPLIQLYGNFIENSFRKQNIITRYY